MTTRCCCAVTQQWLSGDAAMVLHRLSGDAETVLHWLSGDGVTQHQSSDDVAIVPRWLIRDAAKVPHSLSYDDATLLRVLLILLLRPTDRPGEGGGLSGLIETFPLRLVAVANDDDGDHAADAEADDGDEDDEEELPAADAVRHEAALDVLHVIYSESATGRLQSENNRPITDRNTAKYCQELLVPGTYNVISQPDTDCTSFKQKVYI